jgi:hypothetical protein
VVIPSFDSRTALPVLVNYILHLSYRTAVDAIMRGKSSELFRKSDAVKVALVGNEYERGT